MNGSAWDNQVTPSDRVVFVVDDEEFPRDLLVRATRRAGFEARGFGSAKAALEALEEHGDDVSLLLTDLDMPKITGHELLAQLRSNWPNIVPIVITGASDVSNAVRAMRSGAYDYLVKPIDPEHTLLPSMTRAIEHRRLVEQNRNLRLQLGNLERDPGLVGDSEALRSVHSVIAAVAPTDATVLVCGETGTGKELVARAVHRHSRRNGRPFVAVNCGALTENLLESELFGHARGAFTSAVGSRRGLFEEASGGTLFLDEVGELTQATQVRLLRVLQERQVRPVGSNKSIPVDVRIVAATNRDLAEEVARGSFREDLYYRLDVMRVQLPPLRDRREDIPALVHHLLGKRSAQLNKLVPYIEDGVLEHFCRHPWPGNVRELENTIDRAIVLARTDTITSDLLGAVLRDSHRSSAEEPSPTQHLPLAEARMAFEVEYVSRLLQQTEGKASQAARLAGMDPSNFRRLLKRLGLSADD